MQPRSSNKAEETQDQSVWCFGLFVCLTSSEKVTVEQVPCFPISWEGILVVMLVVSYIVNSNNCCFCIALELVSGTLIHYFIRYAPKIV